MEYTPLYIMQSYESKKCGRFIQHKVQKEKVFFCISENISWAGEYLLLSRRKKTLQVLYHHFIVVLYAYCDYSAIIPLCKGYTYPLIA